MMSEAKGDRRSANRPSLPPCEVCENNLSVVVAARTPPLIYFRCNECGRMWTLPIADAFKEP
jgi:hypothetical protein